MKHKPLLSKNTRETIGYASFLLPALILFGVFFIYPSVSSFLYSFTNWHGLEKNIRFIGFDNYIRALQDKQLFSSIQNTFTIVIVATCAQNIIALLLAVLLQRNIRSKSILRVMFFLPSVLSALSIAFVWSYIYNPVDGILNQFLKTIGLSSLAFDWLGNADIALYSIILIILWQCTGYSMVIYQAGLDSVPRAYYEAATIDGASFFQQLRHITIPMIGPAITVNITLCVIGGLKTFDVIYATTGGGPGYSTETMASVIFTKSFQGASEFGYGTALAVILFLIIFFISQVLTRVLRKREIEA